MKPFYRSIELPCLFIYRPLFTFFQFVLLPGDQVEVRISGLGRLANPIVAEQEQR